MSRRIDCEVSHQEPCLGPTCRDAKGDRGELIPIAHIGNGKKWKISVQASSMTGYKAGSYQIG